MSKFYVITHLDGNDLYIPINYKEYTEDWIDAIETAREYIAKFPDGIVEVVEEGGCCLRILFTSKQITAINSFPFHWVVWEADVDTQTILNTIYPG
jgi:hypothetical protein